MTSTEPKTYELTADAIYDMIATGFGVGATIAFSGAFTAELQDRTNIVALIKELQPLYSLELAIEYSNAGRPGGQEQIDYMEKEVALCMEHGNLDQAAELRDGINQIKLGKEI